jgi:hypothetical protein
MKIGRLAVSIKRTWFFHWGVPQRYVGGPVRHFAVVGPFHLSWGKR